MTIKGYRIYKVFTSTPDKDYMYRIYGIDKWSVMNKFRKLRGMWIYKGKIWKVQVKDEIGKDIFYTI